MKYIVYILLSLKDHKLYVGCTSDFETRFKAHNSGAVQATCRRKPLVVLHTEECVDKASAFNRERYYKSLWSGRFKKKLKQEYFKQHNLEK